MSNGLTSVVISVLSLAASRLAETEHQKELAAWIGSRDQGVFGSGVVGFDVSEIPWSLRGYPEDRAFVLRAIEAARAKVGWEVLTYEPREDWLMESLDHLSRIVGAFSSEHITESERGSWPWGKPEQLTLCEKHKVFQHIAGCVVCND